jgi:superfamily II DNA/RNA helicase
MVSVRSERKEATLCGALREYEALQTLAFPGICPIAEILANTLVNLHFLADCAHENMYHRVRLAEIRRLRTGELKILAATNVAARRLDLPSVDQRGLTWHNAREWR